MEQTMHHPWRYERNVAAPPDTKKCDAYEREDIVMVSPIPGNEQVIYFLGTL
jgi:hypothetical protein